MPTPKLILAALLLLVINVAAGNVTLTCTVVSNYTVDTTDRIGVGFKFGSVAPVFPGNIFIKATGNLVYSPVYRAQWNRPLMFNVTLEHYVPFQSWRIDRYRCVYNNSGKVEVRYYDVVAQTPKKRRTTITFTVPETAAAYERKTSVPVSKPLRGFYCSAPPTVETWPNCPAFRAEPNKVASVEYPEWQALQVNGRSAGDVVKAYGVNATIPKPWEYGIRSNVGTLSYVEIDGRRYGPDVRGAPVESGVYLYMVGMPKRWGSVYLKEVSMPLYTYVSSWSWRPPTNSCMPPSCFVLNWTALTVCEGDNKTAVGYLAVAAVKTGGTLRGVPTFVETSSSVVHLPLGSVINFRLAVRWRVENID
jgi:hypothetical protein